jgi:hypothetical protein
MVAGSAYRAALWVAMARGKGRRLTPAGINPWMVFVIVLVSWISPPVFLGIHVMALVPVREAGSDIGKRINKKQGSSNRIL